MNLSPCRLLRNLHHSLLPQCLLPNALLLKTLLARHRPKGRLQARHWQERRRVLNISRLRNEESGKFAEDALSRPRNKTMHRGEVQTVFYRLERFDHLFGWNHFL